MLGSKVVLFAEQEVGRDVVLRETAQGDLYAGEVVVEHDWPVDWACQDGWRAVCNLVGNQHLAKCVGVGGWVVVLVLFVPQMRYGVEHTVCLAARQVPFEEVHV